MTKKIFGLLITLALMLTVTVSSVSASTLTVDSSGVCNDTTGDPYCTIQAALNAAADGDLITIAAGTYAEQLTINKDVILNGGGAAVIQAPAVMVGDAGGMKNIVTVDGAGVSAEITGLTITGPGPSSCGSINTGLMVRGGANLNLHDNTIADVRDEPISGCQNGQGIYVGRAFLSTTGTATITDNVFVGYQKGGIVVDNVGSSAVITGNTVTGAGPVSFIAMNGIQISRGATATVTGNTVTGHDYTPTSTVSVGIMLYNAGAGSTIGPNTVNSNEIGLWLNMPESLEDVVLTGISGNTRNAVGDFSGWATPTGWWVDDDFAAGTSDGEGGDLFDIPGASVHVLGYDVFGTIQGAIDAAPGGATLNIRPGTYTENPVVTSDLFLSGEGNMGVNPNTGARGAEAIIMGEVTIASDNVSLDGLTITNPSGKHGLYSDDHSGIVISNNIFTDIGTSDVSGSGTNFGIAIVSSDAAVNDVFINNNLLTNIAGGSFKSADAIVIGFSTGSQNTTNVQIENNVISNISSSTADFASGGRGAYGVLINHGTGTTGKTVDALIANNSISGLDGFWAHAIGLEGNTPDALVLDNVIDDISSTKSVGFGFFDGAGVMVEDNAAAETVILTGNKFTNVSFGVVNVTGLTVYAVDNWWGHSTGPSGGATDPVSGVVAAGTGVGVSSDVNFSPWFTEGAPIAPNGIITDRTPTYQWSQVTGATQYRVQVLNGSKVLYTITVNNPVCPNGVCSVDKNWRVRAYVNRHYGLWSKPMTFTVTSPSFDSQFTVDAAGWSKMAGAWTVNGGFYESVGLSNKTAWVKHNGMYPTLTYEVSMQRDGSNPDSANFIYFRGLIAGGKLKNGYYFAYNNSGEFMVGYYLSNRFYTLVDWTASAAIAPGGVNTLKAQANGDYLQFFINDTLVAFGYDDQLKDGDVGFGFTRDKKSTGNLLSVDWAVLDTSAPSA